MSSPWPLPSRPRVPTSIMGTLGLALALLAPQPAWAQVQPPPIAELNSTISEVRRETRRLRGQGQRDRKELQAQLLQAQTELGDHRTQTALLERRVEGLESTLRWLLPGGLLLALLALALGSRRTRPSSQATVNHLRAPLDQLDDRLRALERGVQDQ